MNKYKKDSPYKTGENDITEKDIIEKDVMDKVISTKEPQKERNIDKRDILKQNIFSYRVLKNKKVLIYWYDKEVKMLNEKEGIKFVGKIKDLDEFEQQLVMAKITGNFKHGNEKQNK
ncbi:MAG TPA: hypothetical protein VHQ24_14170 [Lachnospiraceae bacterium]|nr:hypothetical protein [Lachnospiraceae bacterium]